ncbi:arsenate reductase-like glutaredoxin family protein [Tumebacillus sp. BK434]|uniref:arsenate reductase family protein n=1 Tax=Tumebacillus sp. BK434 TaxID=2512169 RepID=UPI00104598F1|nr:ArsC/Spx/MgsR family protein [Tumebacillus sp. BK434]TCP53952.1 arsenate reductase-like glutaredoxin family protein [Tumebacillus sp. BK434]
MEVTERNLVEHMLTAAEILDLAAAMELKVHDLLRANSPVYKERKDELKAMGEAELAAVMSTEPTLIKRPIVKTEQGYVVGLDEEKINELIGARQA